MKLITLILALFIVTIFSCKKDKDPAETILRAHKWRFAEFWQYTKPVVLPDCSTDDTIVFETGGVGYRDDGLLRCVPTSPRKHNITWSITPEEDRLTMDQGGSEITYQVISIDHSSFVIETYTAARSRYRYVAY